MFPSCRARRLLCAPCLPACPPPSSAFGLPRWWRYAFAGRACNRHVGKQINEQVNLTTSPGNPVVTCRVNNKYAFVELRSSEECTNALNLNGIPFMGQVRFLFVR